VKLTILAGHHHDKFETVRFEVIAPGEGSTVPDLLLGADFLKESHVLTTAYEYDCDAHPALPVFADRPT
jgi:hypothetical protein